MNYTFFLSSLIHSAIRVVTVTSSVTGCYVSRQGIDSRSLGLFRVLEYVSMSIVS